MTRPCDHEWRILGDLPFIARLAEREAAAMHTCLRCGEGRRLTITFACVEREAQRRIAAARLEVTLHIGE